MKRDPVTGKWHKVASRCHSRKCPSCGVLWAGDTRVKLLRNVAAYGGDVALVTITAPGKERLPWAVDGSTGEILDVVEREAARDFNEAAPENWRRMSRRASARASRYAKRNGGSGWSMIGRSWAFQKRGVLHVHIIVPMATPAERLASRYFVAVLDELRQEYGFGFVDRGRRSKDHSRSRDLVVFSGERAARYLAKYVAGVKGDRLELTETVSHPDVPGHVVYVSRKLTRRSGCTMASLRLRRYAWVLADRAVTVGLDPFALAGDEATDAQLVAVLSPLLAQGP